MWLMYAHVPFHVAFLGRRRRDFLHRTGEVVLEELSLNEPSDLSEAVDFQCGLFWKRVSLRKPLGLPS